MIVSLPKLLGLDCWMEFRRSRIGRMFVLNVNWIDVDVDLDLDVELVPAESDGG